MDLDIGVLGTLAVRIIGDIIIIVAEVDIGGSWIIGQGYYSSIKLNILNFILGVRISIININNQGVPIGDSNIPSIAIGTQSLVVHGA